MNPREFEEFVCSHFRLKGFETILTSYTNDYGIDAFAVRGNEKIAIQSKMYGHTSRKINRQMVMELHGAKDFFECTSAVIATDGSILPDAVIVAKKLNIEILYISNTENTLSKPSNDLKKNRDFNHIWEDYIIPLQGKLLTRSNGETNLILRADWGGVERLSSNGKKGLIKIEIFKQAVNKLLNDGSITRDYINQNYVGRASSGVVLILSQVPFFKITHQPLGLRYDE